MILPQLSRSIAQENKREAQRLGRVSDRIPIASFPREKRKIPGNEVGTSIQVFDLATAFPILSANCL